MTKPLIIELIDRGRPDDEYGRWTWRTRCPENGKVLGRSSEGYQNRTDCLRMIFRHFGNDVNFVAVTL